MSIPLRQAVSVGSYIFRQHLKGNRRYPLVLMLEPLFRCNLACAGCGKIDYPDEILNKRLTKDEMVGAAEECGAPVVVIAGGEPLIHKELPATVAEFIRRKKTTIVCTNALLMAKKIDRYEPSPYFTWSIHLDGDRQMHDASVCQEGVFDKAVDAIRLAKERGFRVTINATFFNNAEPDKIAAFFDEASALGLDGLTVSPGYAYERAPDQQHFLNRTKTKEIFRDVFRRGRGGKRWKFNQSSLFLDFLAGNQTYECTPWGNPTRTVFGWQKPCYLLGEGYAQTFKELMEDTNWEAYGTGNYEKCADCMVHSGFEASAVEDAFRHPLKAARVAMFGVKTDGPMAPDISLENQRPAEYVFADNVQLKLSEMREQNSANAAKISAKKAEARTEQAADAA